MCTESYLQDVCSSEEGESGSSARSPEIMNNSSVLNWFLIALVIFLSLQGFQIQAIQLEEQDVREKTTDLEKYLRGDYEAGMSLPELGKLAVPALLKALDDPDDLVRQRALVGLVGCGYTSALPKIVALLSAPDEDEFVRLFARDAFEGIVRRSVYLPSAYLSASRREEVDQIIKEWDKWWKKNKEKIRRGDMEPLLEYEPYYAGMPPPPFPLPKKYPSAREEFSILRVESSKEGDIIWFISESGLFKYYVKPGVLKSVIINEDWTADTYLGTIEKYEKANKRNDAFIEAVRSFVTEIYFPKNGEVWLKAAIGLTIAKGDEIVRQYKTDKEAIEGEYANLVSLKDQFQIWPVDREDNIWLHYRHTRKICRKYDGKRWETIDLREHSKLAEIIEPFMNPEFLEYETVRVEHIIADSQGVIWLATDEGVFRYDTDGWRHYTSRDLPALGLEAVHILENQKYGSIWAKSKNHLAIFDGRQWKGFMNTKWFPWIPWRGNEDKRGFFWNVQEGHPVAFDGKEWQEYSQARVGGCGFIYSSEDGSVWFEGSKALIRFDGSNWHYYKVGEEIDQRVSSAAEDAEGNLYFGTKGGFYRFDGRKWQKISLKELLRKVPTQALGTEHFPEEIKEFFKGISSQDPLERKEAVFILLPGSHFFGWLSPVIRDQGRELLMAVKAYPWPQDDETGARIEGVVECVKDQLNFFSERGETLFLPWTEEGQVKLDLWSSMIQDVNRPLIDRFWAAQHLAEFYCDMHFVSVLELAVLDVEEWREVEAQFEEGLNAAYNLLGITEDKLDKEIERLRADEDKTTVFLIELAFAFREEGRPKDIKPYVPALIEGLESDYLYFRILSQHRLEELTGEQFSLDPTDPGELRAPAIAQWQKWWQENKAKLHYDRMKDRLVP